MSERLIESLSGPFTSYAHLLFQINNSFLYEQDKATPVMARDGQKHLFIPQLILP